jgi:hypothetical protein
MPQGDGITIANTLPWGLILMKKALSKNGKGGGLGEDFWARATYRFFGYFYK